MIYINQHYYRRFYSYWQPRNMAAFTARPEGELTFDKEHLYYFPRTHLNMQQSHTLLL